MTIKGVRGQNEYHTLVHLNLGMVFGLKSRKKIDGKEITTQNYPMRQIMMLMVQNLTELYLSIIE